MQARIPEVTLLDEVGRGPASVVFRAVHRGASCTVKLPSEQFASGAGRPSSFEQDMLQLARLGRAGYPRVLQLGATRDTPYAILDHVQGESLASLLRRPLSDAGMVALARALTACLQRLHEAGFVHGALQPEHVLVEGDCARVTLLDRGSMSRPVPFDTRVDTRALGALLRECVRQLEPASRVRAMLGTLADDICAGRRRDLNSVAAELEGLRADGGKRRSSYPPPSRESLTISAGGAGMRRARSELRLLRRYWERLAAEGGKVVELLGPAGSGKSRILSVFAESIADEQVQVLSVKCRDSDWAPFSALKRLLDGHLAGLDALEPARRAEVEASLRNAAGPMAARIGLLSPRLASLLRDSSVPAEEGDAQQVFVSGVVDFLTKYLEASGPSVLVVDDIHWLDASSRMVLSRLAAAICARGHLLVCAARDDEDSREPLERFRAMLAVETSETIQLGTLSERDAGELIADYLGLERPSDLELIRQFTRLSDGTPLSLLELLRLTLERGHLRPRWGRWQLDAAAVHRMRLPASSHALIRRRLHEFDARTIDVLRAAAITRSRIDPLLLERVTGAPQADIRAALELARQARLIEQGATTDHRFVHDAVPEELLRGVPEAQRRMLHERVAEALHAAAAAGSDSKTEAEFSADADYEFELARHHAAGLIARNPQRAYEATRRAARRALATCDDSLALSFLKPAEAAARLANIDPDRWLYVQLAETSLRTGASAESRAYFELALARSQPGSQRAHVLGRLAWIHHFESNAEACWESLKAGLAEYHRPIPSDDLGMLTSAVLGFVRRNVWPRGRTLNKEDAETLYGLYTDAMRVSFESGHPKRGFVSLLNLAQIGQELPPSRERVHADMLVAFLYSTVGANGAADRRIASAEVMARELGDPVAETRYHEVLHVIEGWRGNLQACEREALLAAEDCGQYMELGELCYVCFGMYAIEIVRGHPGVALAWLDRAIERVRQSGRAPAMFALLEDAACDTLTSLGRDKDAARLRRSLRFVERSKVRAGGYFHMVGIQSRVQSFSERGELGAEFEALVDEFSRLGQNPKQAHPLVQMYYVHVCHARVHECLRADPTRRAALLPKLELALRELEAASTRIEGMRAHARFARAAYLWFCGSRERVETLLVEAEQIANKHAIVWVNYAAARLRAHMLRAEGKAEPARNQAQVAMMLARQYGQLNRVAFIREEFELAELGEPARAEVDVPYTRRQLTALLRISEANSRELGPERQARLILDELLEALGAERGLLFMRGEATGSFALTAARAIGGQDLELTAEYDQSLVEQAYVSGQTQLAETSLTLSEGIRACVVVALVVREQAVGALYLDRAEAAGGFRPEDAALLQALANQVPVALELSRSLRERERLQQNLRQAQKMEAIGRLAGGIAHDFNNVLAAIQFSADNLATVLPRGTAGEEEVSDIQDSARRGTELTRQLLTFSRGKTIPPRRIILGDIVRELTPMLRRLVRPDVTIEVDVADEPLPTLADPSHIERVLMNLCQNASDAMPLGGSLVVRVAEAPPEVAASHTAAMRGDQNYVLLTVSDTGLGMTDEVRARLFEPFFTTKPGGTGLGLANVYGIVQQVGGQVEVSSEPGNGSTFRVYLPRVGLTDEQLIERLPDARVPLVNEDEDDLGAGTVLVVDDDDRLRRMIVRVLERADYRVVQARNGREALEVVDSLDGLLDVAVTDLNMPSMGGLQLADALLARDPDVKLMFISGQELDATESAELARRNGTFVAKPFDDATLLDKVEAVLRTPPGTKLEP